MSGDEHLPAEAMGALSAEYACDAQGRLLAAGLAALLLQMGEASGAAELHRILAAHGFDEPKLRALEAAPEAAAPTGAPPPLPENAADLAVQLGLRGPAQALPPEQHADVMQHLDQMARSRSATSGPSKEPPAISPAPALSLIHISEPTRQEAIS